MPADNRFILCCSFLLAGTFGCQQNVYYARSMPSEFAAPRLTSIQKLDLSTLARGTEKSELIYPGDMLSIHIATGLKEKISEPIVQRVTDEGTVNVPLVGHVPVVNLTLSDAEHVIQDESSKRGIYRNPQVSLSLENRRVNNVTVVGAVKTPGAIELPVGNCDVLSAIVAAGGLVKESGTIIEVRHPAGVTTITENVPPPPGTGPNTELAGFRRQRQIQVPARAARIDLIEASRNQNADLHLEDGSVVMVMKQPDRLIHVTGLVKKPDQYHLPLDHDINVLDALAMAGGRTTEVADKVQVIRKLPRRDEPVVIQVSVREAKQDGRANIRLLEGDVVSVEETPLTFTIGTMRDFVRFGATSSVPLTRF